MGRRVQRVQTGVRIEQTTLQVLKGLSAHLRIGLGDLLEGIVLHAFEGKAPFSNETLKQIEKLKDVYGHELTAADSHNLYEVGDDPT